MLSVSAFDVLYTHVRAFDDAAPEHLGGVLSTAAGSPVSLTTRSRNNKRVLRAFFRARGGVNVVATFRVERGWFQTWVVADLEVDGRVQASRIKSALELKHSFDRAAVARLVSDMERQADQLRAGVPLAPAASRGQAYPR